MSNSLRWDPYALIRGNEEVSDFIGNHFENENRVLYILGKGFDPRMNLGLKKLLQIRPELNIRCLLIEFDEGKNSYSLNYQDYVNDNYAELQKLGKPITEKNIKLLDGTGNKRRRVGDKGVSTLINNYTEISDYTDIIIDISSLPRGIFFSLIGTILAVVQHAETSLNPVHSQNVFVLTSENVKLDAEIAEEGIDEELNYPHGFSGGVELSLQNPKIWFPILGEGKYTQIQKAYSKLTPHEICPLLPFPSRNPRRSDDLILEYHRLIFDELRIERQNIMYAPEQNPFEVYRTLYSAIRNYDSALSILNGCRAIISTFSSKLLSIGALLAAYQLHNMDDPPLNVGILNVDAQGYRIKDEKRFKSLVGETEIFISWLLGEPYIN